MALPQVAGRATIAHSRIPPTEGTSIGEQQPRCATVRERHARVGAELQRVSAGARGAPGSALYAGQRLCGDARRGAGLWGGRGALSGHVSRWRVQPPDDHHRRPGRRERRPGEPPQLAPADHADRRRGVDAPGYSRARGLPPGARPAAGGAAPHRAVPGPAGPRHAVAGAAPGQHGPAASGRARRRGHRRELVGPPDGALRPGRQRDQSGRAALPGPGQPAPRDPGGGAARRRDPVAAQPDHAVPPARGRSGPDPPLSPGPPGRRGAAARPPDGCHRPRARLPDAARRIHHRRKDRGPLHLARSGHRGARPRSHADAARGRPL